MGGKSEWTIGEVVDIFEGKGFRVSQRDLYDAIAAGLLPPPGGSKYHGLKATRARVGKKWIILAGRVFMIRSRIRKGKLRERVCRLLAAGTCHEDVARVCHAPIGYVHHVMKYHAA